MNFMPMEMKFADAEGFKVFNLQDPKNAQQMKEMHEKMLKEFGPNSDFMKQMHKEMGNAKDHVRFFNHQGELHKEMKGLSEQDAKKWEEFGKKMEKQFGPGSDFEKKMKAWGEKHGKTMEKQFGPGSKFEKEMKVWGEQHGKTMEKQFGPGSDFEQKMRAFKLENGKVRELSAKEHQQMMKELELKMKDMKFVVPPIPKMDGRTFVMPPMPKMDSKAFQIPAMPKMPAMPAVGFHSSDITQITKSLSASQREKNKRQGFLYWSDLTNEQQAKLGMGSWTGNWTISYSKDGESFTIKSDK
ncbi:MAG: BspA family leucine-rich repeat surface protein [Chlorobia bacterium]|nr:BspA family leucine-rich repeat surface protein [Fimbriimonadaceae bacterium]